MKKLYLEIRIECESEAEKKELAKVLDEQSIKLLGKANRAAYVRAIANIDAASGILKSLQNKFMNEGMGDKNDK